MKFDEQTAQAIEASARTWDISATVHLEKDAGILFNEVYGHADREKSRTLPDEPSYVLSARSPFLLALCALQLAEENRLNFDAPLSRHIPEYAHADKMTIRQLFLHESGLPDYFYGRKMIALSADEHHSSLDDQARFRVESDAMERYPSFSEILSIIGSDLEFSSGLKYDWSLTNIAFLETIISRAAGQDILDCVAERVFSKAGVQDRRGFFANTVSYGVMRDTHRVRTPFPQDIANVFTVTASDVQTFLAALIEDKLFDSSSWTEALAVNDRGAALLGDEKNGLFEFNVETSGYTLIANFDRDTKFFYFILANEAMTYRKKQGIWESFPLALRRMVERVSTFPEDVRLEPYGKTNAEAAMRLMVEKDQDAFVPDAKTALSYAYSRSDTRQAYVLMEKRRTVGLVILTVDPKKDDFWISVAIVDKAYQNRGYGKIMLKEALAILKKSGAATIELFVLRHNIPAYRVYLSLGFTETAIYPAGYLLRKSL